MLNINDLVALGIDTETKAATADVPDVGGYRPAALVHGSPASQALYQVMSGTPVTVVSSPPGAGKTTLIGDILTHLVSRTSLRVVVATPRREQAASLAVRAFDRLPAGTLELSLSKAAVAGVPQEVARATLNLNAPSTVSVRTVASLALATKTSGDLLVVDEAYQVTFAELARAGEPFPQLLLVGDPGQIGPVVTADVRPWSDLVSAPHHRGADVFAARDDAALIAMDHTYRLGPDTTAAIAPIYDFPFTSARPRRDLFDPSGNLVPEVARIEVVDPGTTDDIGVLRAVAARASALVGSKRVDDSGVRELAARDVAVVVSRNVQASVVRALLNAHESTRDVVVGTADQLQGGQWIAVVALDPLVGAPDASGHHTSLGRLCVMASRHTTHLTWVHAGTWRTMLAGGGHERAIGVRERLTAAAPV